MEEGRNKVVVRNFPSGFYYKKVARTDEDVSTGRVGRSGPAVTTTRGGCVLLHRCRRKISQGQEFDTSRVPLDVARSLRIFLVPVANEGRPLPCPHKADFKPTPLF